MCKMAIFHISKVNTLLYRANIEDPTIVAELKVQRSADLFVDRNRKLARVCLWFTIYSVIVSLALQDDVAFLCYIDFRYSSLSRAVPKCSLRIPALYVRVV